MGYAIHVERRKGQPPITLDEWIVAVAAAPHARIMTTDWDLGGRLTMARTPGDTELFFADENRWVPVFRAMSIASGRALITTRGTAIGRREVLAFLRHVTAALGAIVRGDDGEEYDLVTGDPV